MCDLKQNVKHKLSAYEYNYFKTVFLEGLPKNSDLEIYFLSLGWYNVDDNLDVFLPICPDFCGS